MKSGFMVIEFVFVIVIMSIISIATAGIVANYRTSVLDLSQSANIYSKTELFENKLDRMLATAWPHNIYIGDTKDNLRLFPVLGTGFIEVDCQDLDICTIDSAEIKYLHDDSLFLETIAFEKSLAAVGAFKNSNQLSLSHGVDLASGVHKFFILGRAVSLIYANNSMYYVDNYDVGISGIDFQGSGGAQFSKIIDSVDNIKFEHDKDLLFMNFNFRGVKNRSYMTRLEVGHAL